MSNDSKKHINILELPSEVLREIFLYLPDQFVVGQVCNTFYNISCRLKAYRLNIASDINSESILGSSRKIDFLYIGSEGNSRSLTRLRLRKFIEHIGESVKELKIHDTSFSIHGFSLLNLMPNLERLELCEIFCDGLKIPQDFKLRLLKLKELDIRDSPVKILEVFDRLPNDVLHKLTLEIDRSRTRGKYFQNQRNIKHFNGFYDINFIDLHQLKLKTLQIYSSNDVPDILKRQDELTSLVIYTLTGSLNEEILNIICEELKSLQELCHYLTWFNDFRNEFIDLSKLKKLENLKKLDIGRIGVETLKTIKSKSLHSLKVSSVPEESFLSLSANCPNLSEIIVWWDNKNLAVEKLLLHFPKLERLKCNIINITLSEGWKNQSLKHLKTPSYCFSYEKPIEFIKICENLKSISFDALLRTETLQQLLIEVPRLTTLCFVNFEPEIAGIIKEHGKNIECIRLRVSSPFFQHKKYAELKKALKDQLPVYKVVTDVKNVSFFLKKL